MTQEEIRLSESRERKKHWKRWGPYLSERAWGTVREDYSAYGTAWEFFPHDHARSRVYRWNEDGLAGICDRHQYICFALALWNEHDPILKERLFGLTGNEGNHGEDVKEYYYYLDSTPTHSYMKMLYKYPQAAFPYGQLVEENQRRGRGSPEFELMDTGVFDENRYFDVQVEYAKAEAEDILVKISVTNRGPETANLRVLPTVWFRNIWSWGSKDPRPELHGERVATHPVIELNHPEYGNRWLHCEGSPELLFTQNETNSQRLWGTENRSAYVKDGINDYVVQGATEAVNPAHSGSKAAAHYKIALKSGETTVLRLRLTDSAALGDSAFANFNATFQARQREADDFYATVIPADLSPDARNVMRQGFAGMLWSKQFYHYEVKQWLDGDPGNPPPPSERAHGRNHEWQHLYNADVISMPDKWEYPWYAAWDLAFHCIPLALVDSDFAKEQLALMLREWYMHPNGQLSAYEWAFGDVNPPVHAWAALRVYKIDKKRHGKGDRDFLKRVFHKLHLVGQSERHGRPEHLPGRLSRPRQHRCIRSQRTPSYWRLHRTIRRYQLDGDVHAQPARHRPRTRQRRRHLRRCRQQVLGALRLHCPRHEPSWGRLHGPVGRRGRFLLRRPAPAGWEELPHEDPLHGGTDTAVRGGDAGQRAA
jgi:hypothetical protein